MERQIVRITLCPQLQTLKVHEAQQQAAVHEPGAVVGPPETSCREWNLEQTPQSAWLLEEKGQRTPAPQSLHPGTTLLGDSLSPASLVRVLQGEYQAHLRVAHFQSPEKTGRPCCRPESLLLPASGDSSAAEQGWRAAIMETG